MAITQYKQEQGPLTPGTPGRFDVGRQGLSFVNPVANQVDNVDVTTGDATTGWSITVTNNDTLASITHTWDPVDSAGAASADADDCALTFIRTWNADPNNLVFGRASQPVATEWDLTYADDASYTSVVSPEGAGAVTETAGSVSSFNQGFGFWAFRTLNANIVTNEDARTLVNPETGTNVLENVAGITIKALNEENPERGQNQGTGFYKPGRDVPVMRRGYIWVPVTVAVKPGDAVHAIIAGSNAGRTTNTGAVDMSSIASFTSVAAAGETAEIELTLA